MLKNFVTLLPVLAAMVPVPSVQAASIYSCITTSGQSVTSDRPIPNCRDSAQRVLNRDGSTRTTLRAEPTIAERQEALTRERAAARAREQAELGRQQVQNWLSRYPNAAALDAERSSNLLPHQKSFEEAQGRLNDIETKRTTMQAQANVHKKAGRAVPPHLTASIELQTNMAANQRVVAQNQQEEINRVNKRFNDLQKRLQPYWSTAPEGARAPVSP